MPRRITHEKVKRGIDVGRCQVCSEEYATHVISIQGVFEHHMCDGCFEALKKEILRGEDGATAGNDTANHI